MGTGIFVVLMKSSRVLSAATFMVFILYPFICPASFVIHLKDGRNFVTERYWEEGGQIKFKRYGGVIGIEKDLVSDIEKRKDHQENDGASSPLGVTEGDNQTEQATKKSVPQQQAPKTADMVKKEEGREKTAPVEKGKGSEEKKRASLKKTEEDLSEKEADEEARLRARKLALTRKVKDALKTYRKARREGHRERIAEEYRRVSQISGELEDLEKEVREKNGGSLPEWWLETPARD